MLDISPIVMLIEAGIFLVTLVLLNQWLFRPLLSHMDRREADLQTKLKSVSANTNEAQQYEEEIASIIESAKKEASRIKKEAVEVAKKEASAMVESQISRIESEKVAFHKELEVKKAELSTALEADSAELKEMLSTKLKGIA
jgi:F-type H+-transporting ATPase subunit b